MDAAEIIEHGVERDRMCVVFKLFRERIRKPSEPPHVHPHSEVLTFNGTMC
jgi:hypothetical protein